MSISEFDDAYEDKEIIRGAILSTPISELTLREPILVDAEASVAAAVNAMNEHRTGCVLVEQSGRLAGIFTERDVLTKVIFRNNSNALKVDAVMTRNPETLEANQTIAYALNKMSVGGFRHVPLVDAESRPVGIISVKDIVDYLVDLFPNDVLTVPPDARRGEMWRGRDGG